MIGSTSRGALHSASTSMHAEGVAKLSFTAGEEVCGVSGLRGCSSTASMTKGSSSSIKGSSALGIDTFLAAALAAFSAAVCAITSLSFALSALSDLFWAIISSLRAAAVFFAPALLLSDSFSLSRLCVISPELRLEKSRMIRNIIKRIIEIKTNQNTDSSHHHRQNATIRSNCLYSSIKLYTYYLTYLKVTKYVRKKGRKGKKEAGIPPLKS